jgi:aryl-phospho-beta-D-glucosidase BglC (GH1 family)
MHFRHSFILALFLFTGSVCALQPLRIADGKFFSGKDPFAFHGVNWFGFNNGQTMVDGLWAGGSSFATDFSTILYKLKLLGFNSIRLPFIFKDLAIVPLNQTVPCHIDSKNTILERTKYFSHHDDLSNIPQFIGPLPSHGYCNDYIPNKSTLERFHWVIRQIVKNDMYVIVDYHPMGLERTAYNLHAFVDQWTKVWASITNLPYFDSELKGRLLLDIMNEPDSMGLGWKSGISKLYLSTMDTLYKMKQPFFLVEGGGQLGYGGVCWGNGFITDTSLGKSFGIEDAHAFFETLMQKPYLSNVIVSPHLYGPTVSKHIQFSGQYLKDRLATTFGFLGTKGYCSKKKCHKFPIVIGEFGSFFQDSRDITYYHEVAKWFRDQFGPYANWMFWCYNQNSGDTGGLVINNWQDLAWVKLDWLAKDMNLGKDV